MMRRSASSSFSRALKLVAATCSRLQNLRMTVSRAIAPGDREALAFEYIRGRGVEIGALHRPLRVPAGADVTYVDRLPVSELRLQYPELNHQPFAEVHVVSDGETLPEFESGLLDFVIANHFLEHCENPIGAMETFIRVLRPGGIVYLAIPDKRYTFDAGRATTGLPHLIRDHCEGPEWSRDEHFREWRVLVEREFRDDAQRSMETLTGRSYSIHFHVWTAAEILEFFAYLKRDLEMAFELERFIRRDSEMVAILRKT
jgi:SAM-dependent methyltransferase